MIQYSYDVVPMDAGKRDALMSCVCGLQDAQRIARKTSENAQILSNLARRELKKLCSVNQLSDDLGFTARSQPILRDTPDIGVSLSHSYPYAGAAICLSGSCGLDIHVADKTFPTPVSNLLFTYEECSQISLSNQPNQLSHALWSHKESFAKAAGCSVLECLTFAPSFNFSNGAWQPRGSSDWCFQYANPRPRLHITTCRKRKNNSFQPELEHAHA